MQPLGRKPIQLPNAKHKPKCNGKNITGWWEDIGSENKKGDRMEVKRNISKEISSE